MNEFLDNLFACGLVFGIISAIVLAIYGAWLLIPRKYRDKITDWVNDMYSQIGE